MPLSRAAFTRLWAPGAPLVLGSNLLADNENAGVASRTLTVSPALGTPGVTILSVVGVLTSSFAGPPTGSNSNTLTQVFSQDYAGVTGENFPQYTLRGYRTYNAAGSADHSVTVTKDNTNLGELTVAMVVLSGGTIVSSSVVSRDRNGAGATHTSGTVSINGSALLVAFVSGKGDVNATAPTQTWPGTWTILQSVARNSAAAPQGHVPLYVGVKVVSAPETLAVQMTNDEGAIMALYAVQ